jgi:hypothetical protein
MKKILLFLLLLIPINVFAVNLSTPVSSNLTYEQCINFQDSQLPYGTTGYFGHCVKATCYGGTWQTQLYLSSNMVSCLNGNKDKYYHVVKDGCANYTGSCDVSTNVNYCTMIVEYDCNRTSNGGTFGTTEATIVTNQTIKTSRKTTTEATTTEATTTEATTVTTRDCNNYLKTLSFDEGKIIFDKLTSDYTITISKDTKKISVNASSESVAASIKVENNDPIDFNKPIVITVTSSCGDTRIYNINLKEKAPTISSNNSLSNITIKGYKINFDSKIYTYNLKVSKNVTKLNINATPTSEKATYKITGNSNLKNNSEIKITVTAENGEKQIYLINVKKSSNIGIFLIIIIIALIALYFGYKLVRRLIDSKSNNGYESKGDSDYEYE